MNSMTVGAGTDDGTEVRPLIDARQRDRVAQLVEDAVDQGATVHTGATVAPGPGYHYPPTV